MRNSFIYRQQKIAWKKVCNVTTLWESQKTKKEIPNGMMGINLICGISKCSNTFNNFLKLKSYKKYYSQIIIICLETNMKLWWIFSHKFNEYSEMLISVEIRFFLLN